MSEVTKEETDRLSREIDAHGEALKKAIERGACLKCRARIEVQILPRAIRFQCTDYICGWSAIYPIRTIGNSERAKRDEALDLIAIAEQEVIKKALAWERNDEVVGDATNDLLTAVVTLKSNLRRLRK